MSDLDGLYSWIFIAFDTTPEKAKDIKELVEVVNELFSEEQIEKVREHLATIKNLADEEFSAEHAIEFAVALKNIISVLIPFFKELRDVISIDRANHLKENLSTFIQIIIMVSLYKYRDNINAKAVVNMLVPLSEVAAISLKIKSSGRLVKFLKTLAACIGCTH